jgi:hypothetical protein
MTDNLDQLSTERGQDPFSRAGSALRGLLTPQATAVAALVLGFVALEGRSILVLGLQALSIGTSVGPFGYFTWTAAASVLVTVLVVLLARPGLRLATGWEATASRAAVLLAGLAFFGSLLVLLGGLLTQGDLPPH